MKKKTGLLIIAFLLFYSMIHLSRYLPDLYTGKFSLVDERTYDKRLLNLLADMLTAYLFTLSAYYTLFFFYPSKKYVVLLATLIVAFTGCFLFSYAGARWTAADPVRLSRFFRQQVLYNAFYTVFAMVFYFVRYAQYKELQQRELALQNRDSELSFLRSQINPHFLFNSLNNIYSMVYHQSNRSLEAISGLSDLLRYMLYDAGETISLEKEIHFIEKYIALEQLRFERPSLINFTYKAGANQTRLPPLLLIPFIENAFKHGEISFTHTWLDIAIDTLGDEILLSCTNTIGVKHKDATGGIGIENVRKRLALLYPKRHSLIIEQSAGKFKVSLRLGSNPLSAPKKDETE